MASRGGCPLLRRARPAASSPTGPRDRRRRPRPWAMPAAAAGAGSPSARPAVLRWLGPSCQGRQVADLARGVSDVGRDRTGSTPVDPSSEHRRCTPPSAVADETREAEKDPRAGSAHRRSPSGRSPAIAHDERHRVPASRRRRAPQTKAPITSRRAAAAAEASPAARRRPSRCARTARGPRVRAIVHASSPTGPPERGTASSRARSARR